MKLKYHARSIQTSFKFNKETITTNCRIYLFSNQQKMKRSTFLQLNIVLSLLTQNLIGRYLLVEVRQQVSGSDKGNNILNYR